MPADDRQLLIATHKGHGPSARELWGRLSPRLNAYAASIVRDRHAAADIVQSVFLQVLRQPGARIRAVTDVPAWFVSLTRNAALNHLRAIRRERDRLTRIQRTTSSESTPTDLNTALESLPRRDREILILKHVTGLTFDQIALALDMNRNTAAARYRSAVARLRSVLDPEGAEELEGVPS
jgi:RNA polymerase sigma-70 factor (ECF subfamily)